MEVNPRTNDAYKLLHEGTLALTRAEQTGIRVDIDYIEKKQEHLTRKIAFYEDKFKQTNLFRHWQHSSKGTININSNAQLAHFLYHTKKLKPAYLTASGQGATDEEALKQLNLPEINYLLQARKLKKVRDTYLTAFVREQINGYIHPFFNLHLVRTYRSSSDSPNFQNIPKRDEESMQIVRRALFPRPGHQLLEVDYSGLEVKIAACYHKDSNMLKYLREGFDFHADMTKQIFMLDRFDKSITSHNVLRAAVKNGFVFPQFYGDYYINCANSMACDWGKLSQGKWQTGQGIELDTAFTLGDHLISKGINSLHLFTEHIKKIESDFWKLRFPEYAAWKENWWRLYKKYGYIDLKTGFRCSGIMGKNDVTNYPVQGAAFHCLLWSFIELDKTIQKEGLDSRLIGQIHDSMILDVNPDELEYISKVIKYITCKALPKAWDWIIVPLDVDMEICNVDNSWADKQKLKSN